MNDEQFICTFCGKICKNKNSLAQHQIRCPQNPEKINTCIEGFNNKKRTAWNKGQTGAAHHSEATKEKLRKSALKVKDKIQNTPEYAEYRKKMSALAKERHLGGFQFRRGVYYNGIKLDSSYEVRVAETLDRNGVRWERCPRFFFTDLEGIQHHYTPDFYLPDYNVYLDPKNDYLIENGQLGIPYSDKDKIRWVCEQNDIHIIILDKDTLEWSTIKSVIDNAGLVQSVE